MIEIAVGDLVAVVCCDHECGMKYLGWHFVVSEFRPQTGGGWTCDLCNTRNLYPGELACALGIVNGNRKPALPRHWLRRIPPLGKLNETEHKEELPA